MEVPLLATVTGGPGGEEATAARAEMAERGTLPAVGDRCIIAVQLNGGNVLRVPVASGDVRVSRRYA